MRLEGVLAGVAGAALKSGAKWLYQQAKEVLMTWRQRRKDAATPPPLLLKPPKEIAVGSASPLRDPIDEAMVDALETLKDMAEDVKDGTVSADAPEAKIALSELRQLLEVALRAPITFEGEPPRTLRVEDIKVTAKSVSGRVTGVRASFDKVRRAAIKGVTVETGDVSGEVVGVDLSEESRE